MIKKCTDGEHEEHREYIVHHDKYRDN